MNKIERLLKLGYKTIIISGSVMFTNDVARYYGLGAATPFGKVARNASATAGGYLVGKKIADKSWDVIEEAVNQYKEA